MTESASVAKKTEIVTLFSQSSNLGSCEMVYVREGTVGACVWTVLLFLLLLLCWAGLGGWGGWRRGEGLREGGERGGVVDVSHRFSCLLLSSIPFPS